MRNGNCGPKDMEEEIPLPDGVDIRHPCQYCPGHWVKVEVMRRRYEAGLPLHHEDDVKQMSIDYHEERGVTMATVADEELVDDWGE